MRAIYHRFDGVFDWKRGWSIIIYILPWERGCLLGKRTLFNLVSMRGPPSCFFMGNLKSGPMAIRRRNSWISDQKWTEKMKEYAKQLARWLFLRSIRIRSLYGCFSACTVTWLSKEKGCPCCLISCYARARAWSSAMNHFTESILMVNLVSVAGCFRCASLRERNW